LPLQQYIYSLRGPLPPSKGAEAIHTATKPYRRRHLHCDSQYRGDLAGMTTS